MSGGTASASSTPRVSQRPRPAYWSAKQVPAVTSGSCHTVANLSQKIFVSGSCAAPLSIEPNDQAIPNTQAAANGTAPGTLRCRQPYRERSAMKSIARSDGSREVL